MSSDLPGTTIKFLVALLKHQAENLLGEQATDIAAGALFQQRLDDWLAKEETAAQLLQAAKHADEYFQSHCKDNKIKEAFTLGFGNLPSVQAALADLPTAMNRRR